MGISARNLGLQSESDAVSHLKERGYRIVCRNWRCALGEIDIIAEDGDTLVFVEVKSRHSGNPKWAVTPAKRKKISMIALYYLKKTGQMHRRARFDVVAIFGAKTAGKIELVRNAFDLAY